MHDAKLLLGHVLYTFSRNWVIALAKSHQNLFRTHPSIQEILSRKKTELEVNNFRPKSEMFTVFDAQLLSSKKSKFKRLLERYCKISKTSSRKPSGATCKHYRNYRDFNRKYNGRYLYWKRNMYVISFDLLLREN